MRYSGFERFEHGDEEQGLAPAGDRLGEARGWRRWAGEALWGGGILRGLATGSDWDQVRSEVHEETVGQIALVGVPGVGKSTLAARLRGLEAALEGDAAVVHEGFFTVVDLAASNQALDEGEVAWLLTELQEVDLVLYVIDGGAGLSAVEQRWISRLRSQGVPLLPVLNKADCVADAEEMAEQLRVPLAVRPLPVSCLAGEGNLGLLIQRILDVQPRLAIPLAREAPLARPVVVQRLVRQSALVAVMLGAEPIPLLDLPLQVANHMRLALRVSAVYGQPGMDYRSRELLTTLGASLGVRYAMQQVLRLVPVLGWIASAALGGMSTWLLGRGLAAYYESGLDALSGRELVARGNPVPALAEHVHLPPVRAKLELPNLRQATLPKRPRAGMRSLLARARRWRRGSEPEVEDVEQG